MMSSNLFFESCPICGSKKVNFFFESKDSDNLFEKKFSFLRCDSCAIGYIQPFTSDDDINKLYPKSFYGQKHTGKSGLLYDIFKNIESSLYKQRFFKINRYKQNGLLLDIGCGDGKFLKLFSDYNWQTFGVETSDSASRITGFKVKEKFEASDEKQKALVYNNSLENIKFPNSFFDVVTLWHVLEHVSYPVNFLKNVSRILKDDGILFISIPNGGSQAFKFFKSKWFHFDVPRHLFFYNKDSIKKLLNSVGVEIIKTNYFSIEYNIFSWMQSFLNLLFTEHNLFYKIVKRGKKREEVSFKHYIEFFLNILLGAALIIPASIFALIESAFKKGDIMEIWCRKKL